MALVEKITGPNYEVKWYQSEVTLKLENATAEALEAAAFDIMGLAKQNIVSNDQVDTGFMVNSVYAKGPGETNYRDAVAAHAFNPDADFFPEAALSGELEAVVAVAAEYGIWQEWMKPYLYPALVKGAKNVGANLVEKTKEMGF